MGNGNLAFFARLRSRPATFQPLMGNGNSASRCTCPSRAVFQPLMGNGNRHFRALGLDQLPLPTPHGEREHGETQGDKVAEVWLPTPHGERERERAPRPRARRRTSSNPSWGTGTTPRRRGRPAKVTFQPLMGNGNSSVGAHFWWADTTSNPSWGTGTGPATASAALAELLPTPHGERERRQGWRLRICVRASNPSWGTGTVERLCGIFTTISFQPLMGNGNTAPESLEHGTHYLPTPHGEREQAFR